MRVSFQYNPRNKEGTNSFVVRNYRVQICSEDLSADPIMIIEDKAPVVTVLDSSTPPLGPYMRAKARPKIQRLVRKAQSGQNYKRMATGAGHRIKKRSVGRNRSTSNDRSPQNVDLLDLSEDLLDYSASASQSSLDRAERHNFDQIRSSPESLTVDIRRPQRGDMSTPLQPLNQALLPVADTDQVSTVQSTNTS